MKQRLSKHARGKLLTLLSMSALGAAMSCTVAAHAATTARVTVNSNNEQSNGWNYAPALSGDGRYVAFWSDGTNLVPGDTNGVNDVFLFDSINKVTERVSLDSYGNQLTSGSHSPSLSYDGRYVALNVGGTISVKDRQTGTLSPVAPDSSTCAISGDGRYVAFNSNSPGLRSGEAYAVWDVYVYDMVTGTYHRASADSNGNAGNGDSGGASISGDGRYVAFGSDATNLVPGDTNGATDIFLHDAVTHQTEVISVADSGALGNSFSESPSVSSDGRYVAFQSYATNLVPGDVNNDRDIFVRDRLLGRTYLVSSDANGIHANLGSEMPSISGDGRYVTFISAASNLVPGDTNGVADVFVKDLQTQAIQRVSVDTNTAQANGASESTAISNDGRFVAFTSSATNLVAGDTNGLKDNFLRDRDLNSDNDHDGFTGALDCNDNNAAVYPGAPEIKQDGIDQDCNGYDLTIVVTAATYKARTNTLTVEATSWLGAQANLQLNGYGAMTWDAKSSKWIKTVNPAGGNPGTVTVSGVEGSETAAVR